MRIMTDKLTWRKPSWRRWPLILVLLLPGLLMFQDRPFMAAPVAVPASPLAIAWSERDEQGKYRLRFSQRTGADWTWPVFLSAGENEEILPAVTVDNRGRIWVAWTELRGVYGTIRYSVFSQGVWSTAAALETPTVSDLAPSLAVDGNDRIWLAFSGSDGRRDSVFVAQWLGKEWGKPVKVNQVYRGPELRPRVVIGHDGAPVVVWQGFAGSGYQTFTSRLTPQGWVAATISTVQDGRISPGEQIAARSPITVDDTPPRTIPPFVKDQTQAAFLW